MFSIAYGNASNPVPVPLNVKIPVLRVVSRLADTLSLAIYPTYDPLYVVKLFAMYGLPLMSKPMESTELTAQLFGPAPTTNELSLEPFEFTLLND